MRLLKKVFIIVVGELIFLVGEIVVLFFIIGDSIIRVNCMVVGKVCFLLLLGLDVMKLVGVFLCF